jgi:hypothetical protein
MRTILAGLFLAAAASPAHAQMIWGGEYERAMRPGAYVPYDGAPYMQRYNFDYGPGIYPFGFGGSASRLWYMEYLDRVDRAEKFGYAMPHEPYFAAHPHAAQPHAVGETVVVPESAQTLPAQTVIEEPRVRFGFGILFGRWRTR